jgi:predicted dehydrogenase
VPQKVRIGIIGAGNYTTSRMLPGFQKVEDCEVTAVANRRRESAEKVATQFGIPRVFDDWRQVIESPDVDAILIGTPPNVHKEMTLAALDAGKHVLVQTRIATTADDARAMHAKAEEVRSRGIIAMLVPPGPYHRAKRFVQHLLQSGYAGPLRHVQSFNLSSSFADSSTPLTVGRNDLELYGPYNAGQIALSYDVMIPWTGHATRVLAQRATFTPERPASPGGPMTRAYYPEEVTVIAETESGALAMNLLNWSIHFGESRVELYGAEGTIVVKQRGDEILAGRAGDDKLQPLPIPQEHDHPWQVEQEFVGLIRGEAEEPSFTFQDGVKNMEYLEASYHSAVDGRWAQVG